LRLGYKIRYPGGFIRPEHIRMMGSDPEGNILAIIRGIHQILLRIYEHIAAGAIEDIQRGEGVPARLIPGAMRWGWGGV